MTTRPLDNNAVCPVNIVQPRETDDAVASLSTPAAGNAFAEATGMSCVLPGRKSGLPLSAEWAYPIAPDQIVTLTTTPENPTATVRWGKDNDKSQSALAIGCPHPKGGTNRQVIVCNISDLNEKNSQSLQLFCEALGLGGKVHLIVRRDHGDSTGGDLIPNNIKKQLPKYTSLTSSLAIYPSHEPLGPGAALHVGCSPDGRVSFCPNFDTLRLGKVLAWTNVNDTSVA